jgi:hypothetical protein
MLYSDSACAAILIFLVPHFLDDVLPLPTPSGVPGKDSFQVEKVL